MRLGDLIEVRGQRMVFAADEHGASITVDVDLYEQLRGECDWSTASDDMTEHALGMIEAMIESGDERVTVEGV